MALYKKNVVIFIFAFSYLYIMYIHSPILLPRMGIIIAKSPTFSYMGTYPAMALIMD